MGAGTAALVHRGAAWLCILLAFVGWVLVLAGVASLQQACNGGMITTLGDLAQAVGRRLLQNPLVPGIPGAVGRVYLAPVHCNKFFSYVWWIWALDTFVLLLLALGVTTFIGTLRGALVAVSAVLLVLLMDTANTFLYFNDVGGLTGTVASRARVLVAGAIISSIAYFLLIGVVGWHNEDASVEEHYDAEGAGKKKGPKRAGAGGLLGGLLGGKKAGVPTEEPVGAGTAGSPRTIQAQRPPIVTHPAGGSPMAGQVGGGAAMAAGSPTYSAGSPTYGGGGQQTYTTTTTVAVPVALGAMPVSTPASAIRTSP